MKRATLFIGFILFISGINAQDVQGVWFAGKNLRIDKYAGVDEFKTDSIFGVEGSILDFTSKDEFVIKALGEAIKHGHYSVVEDTLHLKVDEFRWKALIKENQIKLKLIDSTDYSLELFYKKLTSSDISKRNLLDTTKILNSHWDISAGNESYNMTFKAKDSSDIIDKPAAFISRFSDRMVTTEKGNYAIESYKNHLFLYLLCRDNFEEHIIHLDTYVDKAFSGELFRFSYAENADEHINVAFSESVKIEDEEVSIEEALFGRYHLQLVDLDKNGMSKSLKTVIAYLELHDDFTMRINAYVTELVDDVTVLRKLEKEGVWKVSESHQFISLNFEDGIERYLTIQKIEGEPQLYLNSSPWPMEDDLNMLLEFKKQ